MADGTRVRPIASTRLTGVLELAVKAFALGVPVLYAVGRAYQDGYWAELHLSAAARGYAVDDYLYAGFVAIALGLGHLVGTQFYAFLAKAILCGLTVGLLTAGATWIDRWATRRWKARIAAMRQRLSETERSKGLYQGVRVGAFVSGALSFLLASAVLVVLLLLLPVLFALNTGKERAIQDRAQLLGQAPGSGKPATKTYASYSHGGVLQQAPLLDCAVTWCIVFDQGDFVAVPKDEIFRIGPQPKAQATSASAEVRSNGTVDSH